MTDDNRCPIHGEPLYMPLPGGDLVCPSRDCRHRVRGDNREADRITLAYILREAGVEIGSAGGQEFRVHVANHLIANRDAVLRALGLHEEVFRGAGQRRWYSAMEDVTDE